LQPFFKEWVWKIRLNSSRLIIGGAGASIPELIILGSMFKRKLVLAFAVNVFVVAIVAGYLVEWLIY